MEIKISLGEDRFRRDVFLVISKFFSNPVKKQFTDENYAVNVEFHFIPKRQSTNKENYISDQFILPLNEAKIALAIFDKFRKEADEENKQLLKSLGFIV